MRMSVIATVLAALSVTTACTPAVDVDLGYSDVVSNAAAGDLQDAVLAANEVRESSVIFFFLERWAERYTNYVLVEAVNEQDELHRFLIVADTGNGYELVTNIGLPPSVTGPDASLPGDVMVYGLSATPERDRLYAQAAQAVSGGVGGLTDVDDGDAQFLTRSNGSGLEKTVLYGVSFAPLDDDPDRPVDAPDTDRYAAIEAVYRLWADALATSPLPMLSITTTP